MEVKGEFEPQQFELNMSKLAAAVIHLIEASKADHNFGETKLVKLLYYADSAAFWRRGVPITGTTYVHNQFGPYPLNWHQSKSDMQTSGLVHVETEIAYGTYPRHRWTALKHEEIEQLDPGERKILDEQLARFADFNAAGIVEYSHQEIARLSTEIGEPMAYQMSGFAARPLSPDDRERGQRLSNEIRR